MFSVLMSLYGKENPVFLEEALFSVYQQELLPSEVLIVIDGDITESLWGILNKYRNMLPIVTHQLPYNMGLGNALSIGIGICNNEYIARFDTDDVCSPERFKKQYAFMVENPKVDILGSWVAEFESEHDSYHAIKKTPINHHDILKFSKSRNPFNHMTVMYKKTAILAAGGYKDDYLYEDYSLWVRMINNGAITANLPEVLVYARTGNGMEFRRGGLAYLLSELKVQYVFYKTGFINIYEFIRNVAIRIPIRLLPGKFRKYIYRHFLRE